GPVSDRDCGQPSPGVSRRPAALPGRADATGAGPSRSAGGTMTTVGVLGGGQLGRMLALAGYAVGLRFRFLDPAPEAPAGQLAEHLVGNYTDTACLQRFVSGLDVVTYEFENVPVEVAHLLEKSVPVYPPPAALEVSQD